MHKKDLFTIFNTVANVKSFHKLIGKALASSSSTLWAPSVQEYLRKQQKVLRIREERAA